MAELGRFLTILAMVRTWTGASFGTNNGGLGSSSVISCQLPEPKRGVLLHIIHWQFPTRKATNVIQNAQRSAKCCGHAMFVLQTPSTTTCKRETEPPWIKKNVQQKRIKAHSYTLLPMVSLPTHQFRKLQWTNDCDSHHAQASALRQYFASVVKSSISHT